jgi:hypothetical protein
MSDKLGNKIVRTLGALMFAVGVLGGTALSGGIVWADLEASRFDLDVRFDKDLDTLKCPVMMTESGTISASFTNSLENPIEVTVRSHISEGSATLMRDEEQKLPIAAGETQTLEWKVSRDDAAYDRLVLARVILLAKYPLSSRDASCGVLVVNLPFLSGNQVFVFVLAATFLSMAAGASLWVVTNRPLSGAGLDVTRAMGALAVCILLEMIGALLGHWMLGGLIFMITLLLIGTIIGHFVIGSGERQL